MPQDCCLHRRGELEHTHGCAEGRWLGEMEEEVTEKWPSNAVTSQGHAGA